MERILVNECVAVRNREAIRNGFARFGTKAC